jgi:Calcineurin-like phosphoesterase
MTTIAKIAQLSDFHFTANLGNQGRAYYKRPFLFAKAKGHDISKVARLYQKIEKLERASGKFDLMLATGDLSTDGSRKAIMNALDFLRQSELRDGSSRVATRGLNAGATRRILLPGNHDRFTRAWVGFQKPGTFFERTLGIPTEYPHAVGYRRQGVPNVPDEPAVLFFVFDSTRRYLRKFGGRGGGLREGGWRRATSIHLSTKRTKYPAAGWSRLWTGPT